MEMNDVLVVTMFDLLSNMHGVVSHLLLNL